MKIFFVNLIQGFLIIFAQNAFSLEAVIDRASIGASTSASIAVKNIDPDESPCYLSIPVAAKQCDGDTCRS